MGDNKDLVMAQLVSCLGVKNVVTAGESFQVKPSSTREIVDVIRVATKENYHVQADNYTIGPTCPPVYGRSIVLSLERMDKVIFNRDAHTLSVQPAVKTGTIIEFVKDNGFTFTGTACLHRKKTIGENVVACFTQGEPDFKCSDACLCGLEMVLGDGRVVTVGDMSIKDFDNYQLYYILGGYREENAIITAVYLKLISDKKDRFWLVEQNKEINELLCRMENIIKNHHNDVDRAFIVKTGYGLELPDPLRELLSRTDINQTSSNQNYMMAEFNCPIQKLARDFGQLTDAISQSTSNSIVLDPYHIQLLLGFCNPLFSNVKVDCNPLYIPVQLTELDRINHHKSLAVTWTKGEGPMLLSL
ncbi:FAD-binding protein [Desulfoscipio sp. XC116]|uniref:FAD-binding oxidoreductase n=1 Tax=Desulfoscipio sp. XC116 TaxID=3144975 RepID=UPI00325B9FE7